MSPLLLMLLLLGIVLGPTASNALARRISLLGERVVSEQSIPSVLTYASYLGGPANEWAFNAAADPSGALYLVGRIGVADPPCWLGGGGGSADVLVSKIAADGSLVWSKTLGGTGDDVGYAVAYDPTGHVLVTGCTESANFPVTPGAAQPTYGGGASDGFVTKLRAADGTLVWSTFAGGAGDEQVNGIVVATDGTVSIHSHTSSPDLPTLGAFQPAYGGGVSDSFVARYTSAGVLIWRSFLGGDGEELSAGIALDRTGALYVTGRTKSSNFPTRNALQSTFGGVDDGFVVKIAPAGNELVWSTFLGGESSDLSRAIAVDETGRVAVAGWTRSTRFPVKNPLQSALSGPTPNFDGFVALIAPDGTLLWSTYFGGGPTVAPPAAGHDRFRGVAISGDGVSVVGYTESTSYRTLNAIQANAAGVGNERHDLVITQIGLDGSLKFSTYLGGSANDQAYGIIDLGGQLAIAGGTASTDFPTAQPKQPSNGGGEDVVIAILKPGRLVLDRSSFIPISGVNMVR
ncbi:MAG: hypothetical protein KatS3mg060_1442 [Dehalococcoidia bacterium]|nr:MAG: hypothetical protein KatS3mg060_1442 [Dehalococcoidia bacterium]